MSEHKESIINKLKGIYNHSKNNSEEGNTAELLLQKLLKKHNLLIEDIIDSEKKKYSFSYKNNLQKRLLYNIVDKYVKNWNQEYYQVKNKSMIRFELTIEEFLIIEQAYSVYKKALEKEIDNTVTAFIIKNKIHGKMRPAEGEITLNNDDLDILNKINSSNTVDFDYVKKIK